MIPLKTILLSFLICAILFVVFKMLMMIGKKKKDKNFVNLYPTASRHKKHSKEVDRLLKFDEAEEAISN